MRYEHEKGTGNKEYVTANKEHQTRSGIIIEPNLSLPVTIQTSAQPSQNKRNSRRRYKDDLQTTPGDIRNHMPPDDDVSSSCLASIHVGANEL
eukprot:scaffold13000_cov193-Alexandrium_tamarense.AAC.10